MSRHVACPTSRRLQILVAAAVTASILSPSAPARAAEPAAPPEPRMGTEGKVLLYSLSGIAIVSLGITGASVIARESAIARQRDFPQGGVDCRTAEECGALASARSDADAWTDRAAVAGGLALGTGLSALAVALFWPREASVQAKLVPALSTSSAGVGFRGDF